MSDDLDELERRVLEDSLSADPNRWDRYSQEILSLIERCRRSEERSLYFQRQVDALQLQLDSLNAAMKEGAEAEKELASRWPEAVERVREERSNNADIVWACLRITRLATEESK